MNYNVPPNPNKGRMAKRQEDQNSPAELSAESMDDLLASVAQPQQEEAPASTTPSPKEDKAETQKKEKASKPKSPPKRTPKTSEEDEAEADKEKYSIYLPTKVSMAIRIAHACTRKKYSRIAEEALTDMLFNRYQCDAPGCTARFSISGGENAPVCCPVCGEKKISALRLDILG